MPALGLLGVIQKSLCFRSNRKFRKTPVRICWANIVISLVFQEIKTVTGFGAVTAFQEYQELVKQFILSYFVSTL